MQIEGAMDQVLSTRLDPGDIETYIVSKVRLLKNMRPKVSWQYILQVGSYVATAITLLWVFVPMIINLITAGGEGIRKWMESFPAMPAGAIPAMVVGLGVLFAITSGILTYKTLKE
jgi:hypothetical protein